MSFLSDFRKNGYVLIPSVFPKPLMEAVKSEFYVYENTFIDIQKKQGIYESVVDATHHTPVLCRKMLKLLEPSKLTKFLVDFFGDPYYILNTMGLSKIRPNGRVYTQNVHRDVRSFHGAVDWINTLIMLDDSTCNNGGMDLQGSERLG